MQQHPIQSSAQPKQIRILWALAALSLLLAPLAPLLLMVVSSIGSANAASAVSNFAACRPSCSSFAAGWTISWLLFWLSYAVPVLAVIAGATCVLLFRPAVRAPTPRIVGAIGAILAAIELAFGILILLGLTLSD